MQARVASGGGGEARDGNWTRKGGDGGGDDAPSQSYHRVSGGGEGGVMKEKEGEGLEIVAKGWKWKVRKVMMESPRKGK